ncbi:hypothetical protein OS493_036279 [Desmophyllum pertusum]|uniref:Uncharacterized protein n=1 Tax=Desmophyllum pertusum TaxID=174260 RepID=A0A9X0D0G4_9CNID|nr:hypothetical protein OS493_036279 [Desmophyllum pertusum]
MSRQPLEEMCPALRADLAHQIRGRGRGANVKGLLKNRLGVSPNVQVGRNRGGGRGSGFGGGFRQGRGLGSNMRGGVRGRRGGGGVGRSGRGMQGASRGGSWWAWC